MYSSSSTYYLTAQCPYSPGTFFVLYKITNPVTNPVLSAVNVPVTSYNSPPGANQLGGGTPTLETGGSGILNEPKFRNGFIWVVHSVRSGTGNAYSAVRYVKINTATNTTVEDGAMGVDGYWYFYPAIEVDKDMNVAITYSRSSNTEYAGAFYTMRLNTDPPNTLIGSKTLQEGKANYVKTFGSGRNRWGDYMGIWLDPVDQNSIWMATEYTESPAHTWAVMMGQVRLLPYQTARIFTYVDSLNFGTKEVQTVSDTLKFNIYNFGSDTLRITNLSNNSPQFQMASSFAYPIKIKFNDSVTVKYVYKPSSSGNTLDTLKITSNDPAAPVRNFYLKGRGYVINPAAAGVIYGVTGTQANGVLLNINRNSGAAFGIGSTTYNALDGVSIRPSNKQIYAVYQNSSLIRLNAAAGDGYPRTPMKIANVRGIAFDTNDDLYAATVDGKIYKVNSSNGDTLFVGNSGISSLYSIAINPLTGQLWGISIASQLYKINKVNGSSVLVAAVNQPFTASIAFNHLGRLMGISGVSNQTGKLVSIDTTSGNATTIGTSTGFSGINGIAISSETVGISEVQGTVVPQDFALMQNYPNPFNPITKIRFSVPAGNNSNVNISIYDMTGKLVSQIVNQNLSAGTYEADWNASGFASGVYYYKMTGENFIEVKKMVLMK
ncbi:MAG: T9SS type A sorting domain-containing protein [Bacteroidetes bacterium]|nr:T9SS type A sorting domain-containing protein [Bacteroidota bacterium]